MAEDMLYLVSGLPPISKKRYQEISKYSWREVNPQYFKDSETWSLLKDILLYHPNPIVRHEAGYMIGDFNLYDLVPALIDSVKYDPSIVAKHESAEAMAFIKGEAAKMCYDFLIDITKNKQKYDQKIQHEDVQVTALESLKFLEKEINQK